MLVEQVEALKSIQDAYVAMNESSHDGDAYIRIILAPDRKDSSYDDVFRATKKMGSDIDYIRSEIGKPYGSNRGHMTSMDFNNTKEEVQKFLDKNNLKASVIQTVDEKGKQVFESVDEGFDHPNHKKLDANGNGKVDAQDFAMLRAKKKGIKNFKEFKESLEQLDELSKKTLGSYIKHANIDSNDRAQFIGTEPGALKAIRKREKGISTAVNKLTKEDIEGLDEAHKIGNKVTIHKGTGAGITGHIGEISKKFKGDTDPTYTIFHGDNQAVTVSKKQIKAVKD